MVKKYEHNDIMKILTILGGLLGFVSALLVLLNYDLPATYSAVDRILSAIVGMIIAALTLLCAMKPDDPIPWHWFVLFVLAILLIVFSGLWGGVLVIIGGGRHHPDEVKRWPINSLAKEFGATFNAHATSVPFSDTGDSLTTPLELPTSGEV